MKARTTLGGSDRGSALAEFVLVGALATLLLVGVIQLALTMHVRTTLVDCASEGARVGALRGNTPERGIERTRYLVSGALSERYAEDVAAEFVDLDGAAVLEITVRAPLPAFGLAGPGGVIAVSGRAFVE